MISKRTLEKWRWEALHRVGLPMDKIRDRILKMTQELLDQHLLRKEK